MADDPVSRLQSLEDWRHDTTGLLTEMRDDIKHLNESLSGWRGGAKQQQLRSLGQP